MSGAFTRAQRRFQVQGVQLVAPETCAPTKLPVLQNVRSYEPGTLQSRAGLTALTGATAFGAAVHTLGRLNDSTSFAAAPYWRVFGASTKLYGGAPTSYPQIDSGYSGDPLTLTDILPANAPNPWLAVVDRSRMRKIDVNGHVYPIGIAAPATAPTAALAPLYRAYISDIPAGVAWVNAGAAASGLTTIHRVNTTVSRIVYDSGTTGNCSVVPADFTAIDEGTLLTFADGETLPVQQIAVAVVPTTIAAIIYDSGTTGLCTIMPAASLGTGQLTAPTYAGYAARAGGYAFQPPTEQGAGAALDARIAAVIQRAEQAAATVTQKAASANPQGQPQRNPSARVRQIDFPVNSLVTLGGMSETVRILSVAVGLDGTQCFRCVTANTHAAGDSITGVASFRVSTQNNLIAGGAITDDAQQNTITPGGSPPVATAGIQTGVGWTPADNPALINGRATQPDDWFHLAIRVSDLTVVQSVRAYLDVDASVNNFTQNYFFAEWDANDIISAIQATNAQQVATLLAAAATTLVNGQLQAGASAQALILALGNNQWIELTCQVRDLVQAGTDPTRTLANVAAAEILVSVAGANPVTVDYDALWFSGGYGPDCGPLGNPYVYYYRGRSTLTGAKSNPSPATLGGMIPRRQSVTLTATQIADTQCDVLDWFRFGGTLPVATYIGTSANSASPSFVDVYADSDVVGGETLSYRNFQPWPTLDLPRSGTCNVAGTAVAWVSGDHFNTSWAPGTAIVVNGRTCTLYSQPPSTTRLFLNENAGSGSAVAFSIAEPTLLSQSLPTWWGDLNGVYFGCGDANNPGTLYWTTSKTPDETTDTSNLIVTSGSEILQNGFLWDQTAYVFSSDDLYVLQEDAATGGYTARVTPCGRGLWTRWGFCVTRLGVVFLAKDGIYLSAGGATAQCLTDADLYAIFPHDGQPGQLTNGYYPPDMTQTTRLRLSAGNGWVYFDYVDTNSAGRTLALRLSDLSWWPDLSTPDVQARTTEAGNAVYEALVGGTDGKVYLPSGTTDGGTAIACQAEVVDNQADARRQKLYRDFVFDADLNGVACQVTLGFTNDANPIGPVSVATVVGETQYYVDAATQTGTFGTNLTALLAWNPSTASRPIFYWWDIAYQPSPELATSWLSGPTTHGLSGYQQVACALFAYIASSAVTLSLVVDGVVYTYTLPSTGGKYGKHFLWLQSVKGLTFQYGFVGSAFQLFDADCEVWVSGWNDAAGYRRLKPFTAGEGA